MRYYELLGILRSATPEEIREGYIIAAKKFHPDLNKSPDAPERFRLVQEAYNVLKNPDTRAHYDRGLNQPVDARGRVCRLCKGAGQIVTQKGFFTNTETCKVCNGQGTA